MTTLFEKNHLLKAPPLLQILLIYYNYTITMETHVRELVAVMHKTWKCINLDSGDIWLLDVGLLTDNHGK